MRQKKRTNLIVDIILLIVFLIVYEEKATGTTIHEWLGIVLGLIFIVHIILHWKWLSACTKLFFNRMKTESRINYILDILIYVGFTTIIFTGLMISESFLPIFGIKGVQNHFWQNIHFVLVDITLFLVALHFALHWKWVVRNFKQYIIRPLKSRAKTYKNPEQAITKSNKPLTAYFSMSMKVGYKLFIILALSGLISIGWYAGLGTNLADSNSREYRHRNERNLESKYKMESGRRSERFDSNHRGRHDGKGHHNKDGFFGIDVFKNLLIFFILIVVVTTISNMIKNKGVGQKWQQSRMK